MAWFSMGPAIIKPSIVYLLFNVRFAVVPLARTPVGAVSAGRAVEGAAVSVGKVRIALCVVLLRRSAILSSLGLSLITSGHVVKKARKVSGEKIKTGPS